MANTDEAPEYIDGGAAGLWHYGDQPHEVMTVEAAQAMVRALFDRHRILFAIMLAEHQTGLRLRPPSGKRAADSG